MITLANKLSRSESSTGLDVWYKTELNAQYNRESVRSIIGSDVSEGQTYVVLIPFNEKYRTFKDWSDKDNTYTLRVGDIIFFDTFDGDVTSSNINELKSQYENCVVKSIVEAENKNGATIQFKVGGV